MLKEFKDFVNRGNVILIAVGLVMALYFQKIVDAVLNGVINPIISAIFGEGNFTQIGFNIRTYDDGTPPARISIGLVIDAAISFVAVAFFLFLVIKAYNRFVPAKEEAPAGPTEIELLTQIRDELARR
jgi:large conductance mechanosensitive channel